MKPLILSVFGQHPLAAKLACELHLDMCHVTLRDFPDGETYIQFEDDVQGRDVIIVNSLDHPNPKILPLLFVSDTAKALGAKHVGLCAPYLAYMRQDKQFKAGEGITSDYFASLLSRYFDWLITVDPHLHRRHNLGEIYSIPNCVVHAAPQISEWIAREIEHPILIGPDSESEQWVRVVAEGANAPYLILEKIRHGDHDVEVSAPAVAPYLNHTPVLVDDIISTARTMIETVTHLKSAQMRPPVCIGVHAVFADDAYNSLKQSGIERIVTCNTICHPSNHIDLSTIISKEIQQLIEGVEQ